MALNYKDQSTLVSDVAWQKRIAAAAADVAQSVIVALPETAPNSYRLKALAREVVQSDAMTLAFCRLVAAGFGAGVTALSTPLVDTGSEAQLKTQVTTAFNSLVVV
jgi:hypothetical protein